MKYFKYYIVFICLGYSMPAQQVLQILKVRPGSYKKYEIHSNDKIRYKLYDEHHYRKDVILRMNENALLFEKDSMVRLADIKVFKLERGNFLTRKINKAFYAVGVGYVSLNVINNLILEKTWRADPKAIYISASCLVVGYIIKQISFKRIRTKANTSYKVLDASYQNL